MRPERSRVLACVIVLAVVSLGLAGPRLAAARPGDFNGRTVTAIDVEGLSTLSPETVLFYLGLEVGKPLDEAALNAKLQDFWSRKLVDDIEVDAEPDASGGVRVTVKVKERPILLSVEYKGLKKISKTDIQDKIVSDNIGVLEQTPLSRGSLERLKTAIQDLYKEKGYRFAEARYSLEDVGNNEVRVVFTVDEGDRVRIADISFEGNTVFGDRRLRWAMKKTKESGLFTRLFKKDIYNPAKLQEDLDHVRELYRNKGYKNVTIGDPELEVRAVHPDAPTAKAKKRRMFLDIPIDEGQRWRFGDVTIDGNKQYSDEALLRFFDRHHGKWLQADKIDKAVKNINDLYQNTGYMFVRVNPELRERDENVADVIVHVQENDQFKVGRIEFEGNTRTRDKVLRRELRVQEGYLMNVGALRNSVLKVNQLGYFKLDEEDPVKIDVNTEKKDVNLTFEGEESDRTELQFGGGWSEAFGFEGQFALRTHNFLGRGESLAVSFQSGRFRDLFDLSYFVPWFLDRPQTVGARVFNQQIDYTLLGSQFQQSSRGVVLSYARSFRLFQQVAFAYTLSKLDDRTTFLIPAADGSTVTQVQDLNIDNSSIQPSWVYDSRDNRFEPTRGRRMRASVEYAGGALGGNNEFVRPELGFSLFKPVTRYPARTVFAINAEAGLIEPFGSRQLSPFQFYYLGGENSVRGHRIRSIFLRDDAGQPICVDAFDKRIDCAFGLAKGGDSYFQLNVEYHFLMGGPFRIILFVDGGNVFGKVGDAGVSFNPTDLRWTTGVEMRVLVPVFGAPLRFIYSFNLNPLPEDTFEPFQFSIGTSF